MRGKDDERTIAILKDMTVPERWKALVAVCRRIEARREPIVMLHYETIADRRRIVKELACQGKTRQQMADTLNVSVPVIGQDLQFLRLAKKRQKAWGRQGSSTSAKRARA